MIITTCRHCGEIVYRFKSGRTWFNRNRSKVCDRSPIGLHQWDGTTREVSALAEIYETEAQ